MINWNLKLKTRHHLHYHQKIKYLDINLTKYVQDLHEEYYKTVVKEIKEDLSKWRDIYVHGKGDSILSRCQFFST